MVWRAAGLILKALMTQCHGPSARTAELYVKYEVDYLLGHMTPTANSPSRLRLAGKVCTWVGCLLLALGLLVFLMRPSGEGEGDARPIVATQYSVWFCIVGAIVCFVGGVFRHASSDDSENDNEVA